MLFNFGFWTVSMNDNITPRLFHGFPLIGRRLCGGSIVVVDKKLTLFVIAENNRENVFCVMYAPYSNNVFNS